MPRWNELASRKDACSFHAMQENDAGAAPGINGVVETALYADDFPGAVAFYREVLGLPPMIGDGVRFQSFDSGGGRVLLLFKRGATLEPTTTPGGVIPPHNGSGPLHVGFAIAAASYDAWRARLIASGIPIESEGTWSRGGRSLYFRDPDGNLLELITPGIWPVY